MKKIQELWNKNIKKQLIQTKQDNEASSRLYLQNQHSHNNK